MMPSLLLASKDWNRGEQAIDLGFQGITRGSKDNKNERRDGVMRKTKVEEKGKSEDEIRFEGNSERVIKDWEEELRG
ncbi:hypothetical protein GOBAR_DD18326 [Gossypium barbadense]|nr:hypothetical protein GOBAR_DD18326 [Gossypium barbadense]